MGQWRRAGTGPQKYPRLSTRVAVRISTVHPESDPETGDPFYRIVEETTANLSRGGAFVESWEPLESGRKVLVEIDLPDDGSPLQIVARVAWTRRQLCADSLRRIRDDSSIEASPPQAHASGLARTGSVPGYGLEFIAGSRADLARLDVHLRSSLPRQSQEAIQWPAPSPGSSPSPESPASPSPPVRAVPSARSGTRPGPRA